MLRYYLNIIILSISLITPNIYALEYKLVKKWGGYGDGDGEFNRPIDIAIDSCNYIYIVDENHRVQKFDDRGRFIKKWGDKGFKNGYFYCIGSITVDANDNIYILDTYNVKGYYNIRIYNIPRIQKFTNEGKFISKFFPIKEEDIYQGKIKDRKNIFSYLWIFVPASDLEIDNKGNFYIIEQISNPSPIAPPIFFRTTNYGEYIDNLCKEYLDRLYWDGSKIPYSVYSIVLNRKRNIYYIHGRSSSINFPEEVTFIKGFDFENNLVKEWNIPELINDIAIDTQGNIYVASDGEKFLFRKYDSNGNLIAQYSCNDFNIEPLKQIESIIVDKNGNIYIADYGDHYIYKLLQ